MKKLSILVLAFVLVLTACDALASQTPAPVIEPTSIPPTAEVVVVTVEVPVEVTVEPTMAPPTPVPTETQPPAPEPTEAAPTEEPVVEAEPTQAAPAASADSGGPITVDASLAGGYFKDVTYSVPAFSLRCPPKEITINATVTDPAITAVDFYYRIEDRKGTTISEWKNVGRMQSAGSGAFTLTVSGETVHPDLRKALAWFDFQLVGLNKGGAAVGRTEKIVQLVTYTIDCQ